MKVVLIKSRLVFTASVFLLTLFLLQGCSKKDAAAPVIPPVVTPPVVTPVAFDINSITDTYDAIAPFSYFLKWSVYNVHDPSVLKIGDYYYMYSTDVGYGISVRAGIQIRKSKDLVEWTFVGWVFNSLPPMGANYISQAGGTAFQSLWAPYIMKATTGYRLYYSLSSAVSRLSVIGLATATSPEGPWTETGLVVTSKNDNVTQTNAIDPTVVITPAGEYWMYYGSAYDGIYVLKLDASTGLTSSAGDKGVRVVQRGSTGSSINGNLEGAEIIYNAAQSKYYLFMSYDWLQTKYNVRVARSNTPQGPFLDFNGNDVNVPHDASPMIVAPYQFMGHGGWQGTAHCGVFKDDAGQYYMAHQGRPGVSSYSMDLHVRKIFWMDNGWPVVSPERYAWEDNSLVSKDSLAGNWEQIVLGYTVVPGYADQQTSPNLQVATTISIEAAGTVNNNAANTWVYTAPWLTITWGTGSVNKLFVQKGRDWENKNSTIIFTGLNETGTAIWGKRKYK